MDTHTGSKTDVESFFDPDTFTLTHLVTDAPSGTCALIDPVLDFEPKSGRTSTASADRALMRIEERGLSLEWVLETHVHADHLSAGNYIREKTGVKIGIGANVRTVQKTFAEVYNLPDVRTDGSQFDRLFDEGEEIAVGGLTGQAMFTPGHTPACATYVFGDAAFIGDTLFAPITAARAAIFRAATARLSITRCSASCRCRTRHGFSCATIISPADVNW